MEGLDHLVTSVPTMPTKSQGPKMSQAELEDMVSREAFTNPEKKEKIKIYQLSKDELTAMLEKQNALLKNKSLISNLPDKGAKINARIKELEEQLEKFQQPDQIDGLAEILDNLKIVEKRQTAKFFKQKEFEEEKKTPNGKEKFRAHRNDAYNSKAKENQPIKTLKIDEEREAYKLTLNRISEAEKARQLATLTNREKVPVLLESEPKWRERFDDEGDSDDLEEDDEVIETGLELQQNM